MQPLPERLLMLAPPPPLPPTCGASVTATATAGSRSCASSSSTLCCCSSTVSADVTQPLHQGTGLICVLLGSQPGVLVHMRSSGAQDATTRYYVHSAALACRQGSRGG